MTNYLTVQSVAEDFYTFLASRFPVCCYSDEFVFFPQAVNEERDWSVWDDFSPDSIQDTVSFLAHIRRLLDALSDDCAAPKDAYLAALLLSVANTLEEQLIHVRPHAVQPTFILTVVTAGLIEAMAGGEKDALSLRIKGLPGYLRNSYAYLSNVPELFRDFGIRMADQITGWVGGAASGPEVIRAQEAVAEFREALTGIQTTDGFRLSPDLMERIVKNHTGSGLTTQEALWELEGEAEYAGCLLREEARKLGYGEDWESAFAGVDHDRVPRSGKKDLLRREFERLRDHCLALGIRFADGRNLQDLLIEPLPASLRSIRSADSYNASPGYPYKGGKFYIFEDGNLGVSRATIHPVYRMTAAHEAYPGHHLLDLSRWSNIEPALRPLEYPLFYEGWACFGEDLMHHTGAFERPCDLLILLRRRYRHAVRGIADLMIHTGAASFDESARRLVSAGFSRDRALETVRKYALRPAYQMCYTIGRGRFWRLFESYGQRDVSGFVNTVLASGELLFEDLEKVLKNPGGGEGAHGRGGEKQPNDDSVIPE